MLGLKDPLPDAGIVSEWEQSLENGGEIDSPAARIANPSG